MAWTGKIIILSWKQKADHADVTTTMIASDPRFMTVSSIKVNPAAMDDLPYGRWDGPRQRVLHAIYNTDMGISMPKPHLLTP